MEAPSFSSVHLEAMNRTLLCSSVFIIFFFFAREAAKTHLIPGHLMMVWDRCSALARFDSCVPRFVFSPDLRSREQNEAPIDLAVWLAQRLACIARANETGFSQSRSVRRERRKLVVTTQDVTHVPKVRLHPRHLNTFSTAQEMCSLEPSTNVRVNSRMESDKMYPSFLEVTSCIVDASFLGELQPAKILFP